jgi:hypothetical protein
MTDDELLAEDEAARRGEAMTPAAERAFARWAAAVPENVRRAMADVERMSDEELLAEMRRVRQRLYGEHPRMERR